METTAEFGLGGCFVVEETRVVGDGDLDGLLLNLEGDCDRPGRCSLLEGPDGEGRRGTIGVDDACFPKFVFVVVVSVPIE